MPQCIRVLLCVSLLTCAAAHAASSNHIINLAASCAACHGTNGNSVGGTPVLAGLDPSYFATQMRAFQNNERASTVMHHLSRAITPAEIEQMAIFFAEQPRVPAHLPDPALP